jgi:hypothetical protein
MQLAGCSEMRKPRKPTKPRKPKPPKTAQEVAWVINELFARYRVPPRLMFRRNSEAYKYVLYCAVRDGLPHLGKIGRPSKWYRSLGEELHDAVEPDRYKRCSEVRDFWVRVKRLRKYLVILSSPCGYPHKPLVSYRINRQLSGWILPPLMIRAFGAHWHKPTYAVQQTSCFSLENFVYLGQQCR